MKRITEGTHCLECGKLISEEGSKKQGGMCQDCFREFVRVFNEKKIQNLIRLCENRQPVIKRQENGKPYYAFYLPTMMEIVEAKSEKPDVKKYNIGIDFGQTGLKRIGDLVGFAGFYYDTEYYWATTPEKVIDAWNWFSQKMQANEDYWMAVESDTVRDFIDNNWSPFTKEFRDSLTLSIISLILDLYTLDLMKVDVTNKLSEIRQQMRDQIGKYEKMSRNLEFSTNYKVSRETMLRVTNLRKFLDHLSSESRLARLANLYGFDVKLAIHPDLIINGKTIDVKKPDERYIIPKRKDFLTFVSHESAVIENLSNHISEGFRQKVDIVAIEVNHLNKREIRGFVSKWLGPSVFLKVALLNAINYDNKGIVLLFTGKTEGYFGQVLRCKPIQRE